MAERSHHEVDLVHIIFSSEGGPSTPAAERSHHEVDLVHFEGVYLVHRLSARVVSEAGVLDLVRLLKVDLVQ